jgi:hypothetical protein
MLYYNILYQLVSLRANRLSVAGSCCGSTDLEIRLKVDSGAVVGDGSGRRTGIQEQPRRQELHGGWTTHSAGRRKTGAARPLSR